jgi:hypothetical protein
LFGEKMNQYNCIPSLKDLPRVFLCAWPFTLPGVLITVILAAIMPQAVQVFFIVLIANCAIVTGAVIGLGLYNFERSFFWFTLERGPWHFMHLLILCILLFGACVFSMIPVFFLEKFFSIPVEYAWPVLMLLFTFPIILRLWPVLSLPYITPEDKGMWTWRLAWVGPSLITVWKITSPSHGFSLHGLAVSGTLYLTIILSGFAYNMNADPMLVFLLKAILYVFLLPFVAIVSTWNCQYLYGNFLLENGADG